jgi:hypothetical protein
MTKYVAFGDLHYGFNKKVSPEGKLTSTPVHELSAYRAMFKFILDFDGWISSWATCSTAAVVIAGSISRDGSKANVSSRCTNVAGKTG